MKKNPWLIRAVLTIVVTITAQAGAETGNHAKPDSASSPARAKANEGQSFKVVGEWKEDQEIQPKSVNEMTEAVMKRFEAARKKISADDSLTEEQKKRQLDMIAKFEVSLLESTEALRRQKAMAFAVNICGGAEWDWSFLLGVNKGPGLINKVKNWAAPGVVGMACVTVAWTRNIADGWPDFLPTIGGGLLAGPRVEVAEYENDGTRRKARLEPLRGTTVMVPLGNQSGVTKIKDLTGPYVGVSADWAFEGRAVSTGLSTTYNTGAYVKADYSVFPPKPKVAMFSLTKTGSAQDRLVTPKGQVLYYLGADLPYVEEAKAKLAGVVPFFGNTDREDPPNKPPVTEEELKKLVDEGQKQP